VLRFLGTMHDRSQVLRYHEVSGYRIHARSVIAGHDDLLVHEVRLGDTGTVVHELLFAGGAEVVIECASLEYEELPRSWSPAGRVLRVLLGNRPALLSGGQGVPDLTPRPLLADR
jgi:hypothetical protein